VPSLLKTSKTPKDLKSKKNNKGRTTYHKPTLPQTEDVEKYRKRKSAPIFTLKKKPKTQPLFSKKN
jgi:hypothetical protein